ncbi:hypothetical protein SEA_JACOREN57_56 [Mycobacterium phage JacoRen57]|nr:hypothetical protein SEA_JACOREN57_56 [Mycobacterium phage JacoRen57]
MSERRNREDAVLDAIDELVDWQLRGGDQSDSFHGHRWRDEHPCPWCGEGYHFLPITARMFEMRNGSYATDEFGQGIVDPDYKYEEDTSQVLCPGSDFHGPPFYIGSRKVWDKQSRERYRAARYEPYPRYEPRNSQAGATRGFRFVGPWNRWTISLDDNRVIEEYAPSIPGSLGVPDRTRPRVPIVVSQELVATFELDEPIRNPDAEWLHRNWADVDEQNLQDSGLYVRMKPIVVPFAEITVHSQNPFAEFPDYLEVRTDYPIERHPWFMEFCEPVSNMIDESRTNDNERPRQNVEDASS